MKLAADDFVRADSLHPFVDESLTIRPCGNNHLRRETAGGTVQGSWVNTQRGRFDGYLATVDDRGGDRELLAGDRDTESLSWKGCGILATLTGFRRINQR